MQTFDKKLKKEQQGKMDAASQQDRSANAKEAVVQSAPADTQIFDANFTKDKDRALNEELGSQLVQGAAQESKMATDNSSDKFKEESQIEDAEKQAQEGNVDLDLSGSGDFANIVNANYHIQGSPQGTSLESLNSSFSIGLSSAEQEPPVSLENIESTGGKAQFQVPVQNQEIPYEQLVQALSPQEQLTQEHRAAQEMRSSSQQPASSYVQGNPSQFILPEQTGLPHQALNHAPTNGINNQGGQYPSQLEPWLQQELSSRALEQNQGQLQGTLPNQGFTKFQSDWPQQQIHQGSSQYEPQGQMPNYEPPQQPVQNQSQGSPELNGLQGSPNNNDQKNAHLVEASEHESQQQEDSFGLKNINLKNIRGHIPVYEDVIGKMQANLEGGPLDPKKDDLASSTAFAESPRTQQGLPYPQQNQSGSFNQGFGGNNMPQMQHQMQQMPQHGYYNNNNGGNGFNGFNSGNGFNQGGYGGPQNFNNQPQYFQGQNPNQGLNQGQFQQQGGNLQSYYQGQYQGQAQYQGPNRNQGQPQYQNYSQDSNHMGFNGAPHGFNQGQNQGFVNQNSHQGQNQFNNNQGCQGNPNNQGNQGNFSGSNQAGFNQIYHQDQNYAGVSSMPASNTRQSVSDDEVKLDMFDPAGEPRFSGGAHGMQQPMSRQNQMGQGSSYGSMQGSNGFNQGPVNNGAMNGYNSGNFGAQDQQGGNYFPNQSQMFKQNGSIQGQMNSPMRNNDQFNGASYGAPRQMFHQGQAYQGNTPRLMQAPNGFNGHMGNQPYGLNNRPMPNNPANFYGGSNGLQGGMRPQGQMQQGSQSNWLYAPRQGGYYPNQNQGPQQNFNGQYGGNGGYVNPNYIRNPAQFGHNSNMMRNASGQFMQPSHNQGMQGMPQGMQGNQGYRPISAEGQYNQNSNMMGNFGGQVMYRQNNQGMPNHMQGQMGGRPVPSQAQLNQNSNMMGADGIQFKHVQTQHNMQGDAGCFSNQVQGQFNPNMQGSSDGQFVQNQNGYSMHSVSSAQPISGQLSPSSYSNHSEKNQHSQLSAFDRLQQGYDPALDEDYEQKDLLAQHDQSNQEDLAYNQPQSQAYGQAQSHTQTQSLSQAQLDAYKHYYDQGNLEPDDLGQNDQSQRAQVQAQSEVDAQPYAQEQQDHGSDLGQTQTQAQAPAQVEDSAPDDFKEANTVLQTKVSRTKLIEVPVASFKQPEPEVVPPKPTKKVSAAALRKFKKTFGLEEAVINLYKHAQRMGMVFKDQPSLEQMFANLLDTLFRQQVILDELPPYNELYENVCKAVEKSGRVPTVRTKPPIDNGTHLNARLGLPFKYELRMALAAIEEYGIAVRYSRHKFYDQGEMEQFAGEIKAFERREVFYLNLVRDRYDLIRNKYPLNQAPLVYGEIDSDYDGSDDLEEELAKAKTNSSKEGNTSADLSPLEKLKAEITLQIEKRVKNYSERNPSRFDFSAKDLYLYAATFVGYDKQVEMYITCTYEGEGSFEIVNAPQLEALQNDVLPHMELQDSSALTLSQDRTKDNNNALQYDSASNNEDEDNNSIEEAEEYEFEPSEDGENEYADGAYEQPRGDVATALAEALRYFKPHHNQSQPEEECDGYEDDEFDGEPLDYSATKKGNSLMPMVKSDQSNAAVAEPTANQTASKSVDNSSYGSFTEDSDLGLLSALCDSLQQQGKAQATFESEPESVQAEIVELPKSKKTKVKNLIEVTVKDKAKRQLRPVQVQSDGYAETLNKFKNKIKYPRISSDLTALAGAVRGSRLAVMMQHAENEFHTIPDERYEYDLGLRYATTLPDPRMLLSGGFKRLADGRGSSRVLIGDTKRTDNDESYVHPAVAFFKANVLNGGVAGKVSANAANAAMAIMNGAGTISESQIARFVDAELKSQDINRTDFTAYLENPELWEGYGELDPNDGGFDPEKLQKSREVIQLLFNGDSVELKATQSQSKKVSQSSLAPSAAVAQSKGYRSDVHLNDDTEEGGWLAYRSRGRLKHREDEGANNKILGAGLLRSIDDPPAETEDTNSLSSMPNSGLRTQECVVGWGGQESDYSDDNFDPLSIFRTPAQAAEIRRRKAYIDQQQRLQQQALGAPRHQELDIVSDDEEMVIMGPSSVHRSNEPEGYRRSKVNVYKTFDNFVPSPENQTAIDTARKIVQAPDAQMFSPFYVYSASGLGKTHLLSAIVNELAKVHPEIKVTYIRAEDFIYNYVLTVKQKNSRENRRNQDTDVFNSTLYTEILESQVVLVDDVQNFAKAEKSRDAFFEVAAAFLENPSHQLILASDVHPTVLQQQGFNPRLTSRFASGICYELVMPSVSTRRTIVSAKSSEIGIKFSETLIDYIANHLAVNIREIEGAVKSVSSQILTSGFVSLSQAVKLVGAYIPVPKESQLKKSAAQPCQIRNPHLNIEEIKRMVARAFSVTVADMESSSKRKAFATARSMAMVLAKELLNRITLCEIGAAFNRDHSSVIEAIQRTRSRIQTDDELRKFHDYLTEQLTAPSEGEEAE